MRVCHSDSAVFDDPNLVSCAGLVPVLVLAERAGLHRLIGEHVRVPGTAGSNSVTKVVALIAGMIAGADNIAKMDLLRHGAMGRLFTAVRAPSTLGTFLRAFTFGYVRQLDAVAARFLVNLTAQVPVLAGAGQVAFLDIDSRDQSDVRVSETGRRLRVLQGQGTQRPVRDHLHPAVRAADRGHPPAQGLDVLPEGRLPAGRRRPGHRQARRGDRPDHDARRQRVLRP